MGKSSHKSRKRRRSLSADRLASLENKMVRLIDILSQRRVRSPSGPFPSDSETVSAPLVRQEGLMDPKFLEVEEDVDEEDDTSLSHSKQVNINESSFPAISASEACNTDSLTKQLFGPDLEGEETSQWNELVTRKWCDLTRKGLAVDQRELLFKKFAPPEALAFLKGAS
ncbi:hypothetical protein ALC57_10925 [Trachymyrmex cornetzi]|uniref:Uncharacterized protein n=1 Tax=Trachymyrmex cornetzi TaxID=471704 RepID=A0A151J361_9HYME|nr:hypothetical protein ALC57_10925 [Trachymyrmex cornetzi]